MDLKGGSISYANYHSHLTAAFKRDCEDFLQEFEKLRTFNYSHFAEIWQKFNFSYIFAGHNYVSILNEFCENMFFTVKKFLVFPRNIYTQVGAFYLLFGLYYKQPVKCWIPIRFTLSDYKVMCELMDKMRQMKQFDVLYCYAKMKTDHAFLFVYLPKPLGPEDRFIKFHYPFVDDTFKLQEEESSMDRLKEVMANNIFQQFIKTNEDYEGRLRKLAEKNPSLTVFDSSMTSSFETAYENIYYNNNNEENITDKRRKGVLAKAVANKRATYRGMKKVPTAVDIAEVDLKDVTKY